MHSAITLTGKIEGHSRHLYDVYKLISIVPLNAQFHSLAANVRKLRAKMTICPSACADVDLPNLLHEIIASNAYRKDYQEVTNYFLNENIPYDVALEALRKIADSGMFVSD